MQYFSAITPVITQYFECTLLYYRVEFLQLCIADLKLIMNLDCTLNLIYVLQAIYPKLQPHIRSEAHHAYCILCCRHLHTSYIFGCVCTFTYRHHPAYRQQLSVQLCELFACTRWDHIRLVLRPLFRYGKRRNGFCGEDWS